MKSKIPRDSALLQATEELLLLDLSRSLSAQPEEKSSAERQTLASTILIILIPVR